MRSGHAYREVVIEGHRLFVNPVTGRVFPLIRGGDGDEDPPKGDPPKTLTQEDADRIAGRARDEGRKAAASDLAEALGCTVDEAKAKLDKLAADEDERKDETVRANEERDAARSEANQAIADAARERQAIKVERRLTAAGVGVGIEDDPDGTKAEAALKRVARTLDLTADATDDDIAAEIKAAKAEAPGLFTAPTGTGAPALKPGIKPATPPQGKGGAPQTMAELGQQALREAGKRFPNQAA